MNDRISCYGCSSMGLAVVSELGDRGKSTSPAKDPNLWKSSKTSTVCYTVSHLLHWARM